jgi:hypothetical protein
MPGTPVNLGLEVLIGFVYGYGYGSNLEYWRELAVNCGCVVSKAYW